MSCADAHCAPPIPTDAAGSDVADDAGDEPPVCSSRRGHLFVGPVLGRNGATTGVCGELNVYLFDLDGDFIDATTRPCSPDANFIDLGMRPAGRYQLAVDGVGAIGGGGDLIRGDFCTGVGASWRACSPIWVEVAPCGITTVPVTLECDQTHIDDCP